MFTGATGPDISLTFTLNDVFMQGAQRADSLERLRAAGVVVAPCYEEELDGLRAIAAPLLDREVTVGITPSNQEAVRPQLSLPVIQRYVKTYETFAGLKKLHIDDRWEQYKPKPPREPYQQARGKVAAVEPKTGEIAVRPNSFWWPYDHLLVVRLIGDGASLATVALVAETAKPRISVRAKVGTQA